MRCSLGFAADLRSAIFKMISLSLSLPPIHPSTGTIISHIHRWKKKVQRSLCGERSSGQRYLDRRQEEAQPRLPWRDGRGHQFKNLSRFRTSLMSRLFTDQIVRETGEINYVIDVLFCFRWKKHVFWVCLRSGTWRLLAKFCALSHAQFFSDGRIQW